jgi:hypothetical protein
MKFRWLPTMSLLALLCIPSLARDRQAATILVRAVDYRAIPHEKTTYYTTAGRSDTSCYGRTSGTATNWGFMTDISLNTNVNCTTVTTPPEVRPFTIAWLEVYNLVEVNALAYTIRCTASWFGSACTPLKQGDTFPAEVKDTTMWITNRRGGNMGKEMRTKFVILDVRQRPSSPDTETPSAKNSPKVEATAMDHTKVETLQPTNPGTQQSVPARAHPAVAVTSTQQLTQPRSGTCDISGSVQSGGLVPITICSVPYGATVVLYGSPVGNTPVTSLLAPGSYPVKVVAQGYFEWTHIIRVEAGTPQGVMAQLKPVEQ